MIHFLKYRNSLIDISQALVMGVINVTPDSFYIDSRIKSSATLLSRVEKMVEEGVDILDIGAYSTRPHADEVDSLEETRRLEKSLSKIRKEFPNLPISVDTFRSSVASFVVNNFEVGIINDIGGGTLDKNMFETIAELHVTYILMHIKGNPQTMQSQASYSNVSAEVLALLQKRLAQLRLLGHTDVIVDPGFGFAKTVEQNYELLLHLSLFRELNVPILAGLSRKSMIYKTLDTDAEHALTGTIAANFAALMGGANILRVHDVLQAKQTISIFRALNQPSFSDK
ncbi:MAG: dihydropteroate synthase [Porphyromonadaceae bacterium CG2_30_38_12]|nr:MAG: dihydropteroate synthase [Porphyromonadaceae bacterium CG2_30_38_12]